MPLTPEQRARTIQQIIEKKNALVKSIEIEMDRLDDELRALDDKVATGADLTPLEIQHKKTVKRCRATLETNAQRIDLLALAALDSSAGVASLANEVNAANQQLTEAQQDIQNLTTSLTNLGSFLTGAASLLTSLTGLLAALA